MLRSEIPAILAKARAADVARIPLAALAKMTPADVTPRLQAADEMRRRARARGLPGDQARMLADLASEVLATADPQRAAAIIKGAGVTDFDHEPMSGTHTHEHTAFGLPGEAPTHKHEHTHDDNHNHQHEHAGKSAKAAAPRPGTGWAPLRKDIAPPPAAPERSVSVDTPALSDLGDSRSFAEGLTKLNRQGRLGQAAKELALVADAGVALKRGQRRRRGAVRTAGRPGNRSRDGQGLQGTRRRGAAGSEGGMGMTEAEQAAAETGAPQDVPAGATAAPATPAVEPAEVEQAEPVVFPPPALVERGLGVPGGEQVNNPAAPEPVRQDTP